MTHSLLSSGKDVTVVASATTQAKEHVTDAQAVTFGTHKIGMRLKAVKTMSKDTIYREDAIKAINARTDWYQVTCNGKQIAVMLMAKDVNKTLEILPSADRPQEWIPCSERLPSNFSEDETVLATTDVDGLRVMLMLAVDVERFYLKGYVSAWMPSPKPWKGADDE